MNHQSAVVAEPATPQVVQSDLPGILQRQGVTEKSWSSESETLTDDSPSECLTDNCFSPPATNGSNDDASDNSPNFSRLEVRHGRQTITDDDYARALVTHWLINELAPLLGLDPSKIEIRVNSEAESRTNARGASGLMEGGTILLHPARYRPETPKGRYLLAHESVHVAQRSQAAQPRTIGLAEREAHHLAREFAAGRNVQRPQEVLPMLAMAADNDVVEDPLFDAAAASSRNQELSQIKRWLHGLWVSDGDVDNILTLLASLPKATAMALVRALSEDERYYLVDNINSNHYKPFREQVLLVYRAVPGDEIKAKFNHKLLIEIDMFELSNDEVFAIDHVYQQLQPPAQQKVLDSKIGKAMLEIEKHAANPANMKKRDDDYKRSVEEETKERDELAQRKSEAQKALQNEELTASGETKGKVLQKVIEQCRELLSGLWIKDAEALQVLELIGPYAANPAALQAIVDGLVEVKEPPADDPGRYKEKNNYLDVLLEQVPIEKLFGDAKRVRTLVQLMSFRPPYKNIIIARKLIGATFANSEDAFLAFHLVKALPEREQQAFRTAGGGTVWSKIVGGLSLSQREALTINLYNGGKEQGDRNSILMQLMDDRIWAKPPRLSGLIRMAIAAGNYAWIFAESERRITEQPSVLEDEDFLAVVEKYKLYNPRQDAQNRDGKTGPRTTFDPNAYKAASYRGRAVSEEGPWGWIGDKIFGGLDFLRKSKADVTQSLYRKSMGGKGVNVAELQDIFGGDFFGLTFERHENLGMAGREARQKKEGINFAEEAQWDRGQGVLKMTAGDLALANLHLDIGSAKLEAGRGSIRTFDLDLHYPTKDSPGPSIIDLYAGEIELEDVSLILPDSMVGANQAALGRLHVVSRESGSDPRLDPKPRDGLLALGFGVFGNVFRVGKSGGELAENLLKPNTPMEVDISFASIKVKGLTTSSGQYAESLAIKDFTVRGGGNATAYRKALELSKLSLETRISRERKAAVQAPDATHDKVILELEKQRRHVDMELGQFGVLDALLERQKKHNEDPSSAAFTGADEQKLAELNTKLAGVVVELGSIAVEGIEGMAVKRFAAENIHGQGRSLGAIMGTGFGTQLLQGQSTIQPGARSDATFSLDIGRLETSAIDIQGEIPTAERAWKDWERLSKKFVVSEPGQLDRLNQLRHRAETAEKYQGLLQRGIENLSAEERKTLFALRTELEAFEAARAFHVGKVSVEGTSLSASDTGKLTAQVDAITAEDIREGSSGVSVESVKGSALSVTANVEGGAFGLREWRKNLKDGTVSAGQLDFTNIRHADSGMVVKTLGLRSAEVGGVRGGPLAVKATGIEVANVSVTVTRKILLAERELLMSVPFPFFRDRDRKKVTAIDQSLDELNQLDARVAQAAAALEAAKEKSKPGQLKKAEDALAAAEKARVTWQEQLVVKGLSLNDLNIVVEGLGDILGEDFDFAAAIRKGITVRGAGDRQQMISGATLTDSRIPGLSGKKVTLGPTGGAVTVSERGASLKDFFIDSIVATELDYQGGGNHLWSKGTSTLSHIKIDASVENRETKDADGFSQWVPSTITLTDLKIDKIFADRLGFASKSTGIQIDLQSGFVENVFAKNFVIKLPENEGEDVKLSGKAGVGGLHKVRLHALVGKSLAAKGVLDGSDVSAEFFGDAKQKYHIGDLSLREGEISDPTKGTVKISVAHFSGDVTHRLTKTGDEYDLRNVKFGSFKIDKGATWEDDGTKLEVMGGATLTNFHATATIQRKKVGKEFRIEQVTIPELGVDQIDAAKVHVAIAAKNADPKTNTKAQPSKNVTLANATITNLKIEGFDLVKGLGAITTDSENISDLGIQIGKKGEKAFKDVHLSVKGTGLKGTLKGPGKFAIDLGHIETISGSYADNETGVKDFSAKELTGQVEIGPNYVHVFDLNAGPVKLGHTEYADTSGNKVVLEGARASAVHLVDVMANFAVDEKDSEQKLSSLELKELRFDDLVADGFNYKGSTTKLNKDKQTETSNTEISAKNALFKPLHLEELNLDLFKHTQHVKADIGQVSVTGFKGVFDTTVAGQLVKKTTVATNVTGGNLRANLNFAEVKLASGADWTRASGTFHLGKLGLSSPDVTVTEIKEGKESKITVGVLDSGKGTIDLTGLDATIAPNGTIFLKLEDVIAHGLRIGSKSGGKSYDIGVPMARIKGIAVSLGRLGLEEGIEILAAQTGEITTQGLKVDIHIDRKVTAPSADPSKPAEVFVLQPLKDSHGNLPLIVPYELFKNFDIPVEQLNLPVSQGAIDLDKLELKGFFGEDEEKDEEKKKKKEKKYTLSIRNKELVLTIDHPDFPTLDYPIPTTKGRPGLHPDQGKRGTIVLQELIESYLNEAPDPAKPGPTDLGSLDYFGFEKSNLQLGTGRIGTPSNFINLSSPESGANLFRLLNSVRLGKNITLETEKLRASEAGFTLTEKEGTKDEKKKAGKTGAISFTNVKVQIKGLGNSSMEFDISLHTESGFITSVNFGDVKLLSEEKLAQEKGPEVQEKK